MADPSALFYAVSATIVPSDDLSLAEIEELHSILEADGAVVVPLLPDGRVDDVSQLSHIISTNVYFPEYNRALEHNCHIVRPSWVRQSKTRGRQSQTRQHSPDPALIFREVVLTSADLPEGDKNAIIAGVIALGGMHSGPLTKLVTHIVTLSEDHVKVHAARSHGVDAMILLPHWFDDCLKLGKRISEKPYLLPNPELLDPASATVPSRQHANSPVDGATSAIPMHPPDFTPPPSSPTSPSSVRKKSNVLGSRHVFFSRDLNVNDHLTATLIDMVRSSGGSVTQSVQDCDLYIGTYRDGQDYIAAAQAKKDVANLSWFYDVVTRNRWSDPLAKLLHYPIPRDGIPGFQTMKISLSNYSGEARIYLENLATAAGALFTKTMNADNTHLITAHKLSEKCDAAQEWNVDIVNHLWLEESYAKCKVQSMTNQRYTHFPPRTNLGEVVGQTSFNLDSVRQMYFPDAVQDDNAMDLDLPDESAQNPKRSHGSIRIPTAHTAQPLVAEDPDIESTHSPAASKASRLVSTRVPPTPVAGRSSFDGKENEYPPSTGRSSKQKAMEQLHKAKDDIALFQREMKRKGGVTHGGKRSKLEDDQSESTDLTLPQKMAKDIARDKSELMSDPRNPKKVKTNAHDLPPIRYKMLVSGDTRWQDNLKRETSDKKVLRRIGIQLVSAASEADLLCAPRVVRTRKFLVALANAPEVVSTAYLDYALQHQDLHDTTQYPLNDDASEKKLNMSLTTSLSRAKINQNKLLRGWTIYISGNIDARLDTFRDIVMANGGTAIPYRGRTGVTLPRRRLPHAEDPDAGAESQHQGGDVECDYVYLVSSTKDDEVKIWPTFRQLARKQDLQARIVKTDWLLNLAMVQRIEWEPSWELRECDVPGMAAK